MDPQRFCNRMAVFLRKFIISLALSLLKANKLDRYYLLYANYYDDIVEFPPGFELLAGDAFRRNFTAAVPEPPKSEWTGYEITQQALMEKSIGFSCLHFDSDDAGTTKLEEALNRHYLPDKAFIDANCPSGIRAEVAFPSCWNGKDATAPDHKSHMV